jgi:hypothetical protein
MNEIVIAENRNHVNMIKFPSSNDPSFLRVIGILRQFRKSLVFERAEQHPQTVPNEYGRRLPPEVFAGPLATRTSWTHTGAANSSDHARPGIILNDGDQIEAEIYNYALSVDVLGFLKPTHFRKDDQDQPQTLQCTVSSFLRGGIQSFLKDIATIDDGGQTTSGQEIHTPSTLKLLWVHVPINNTKWVHVYSPIAPRVVKY